MDNLAVYECYLVIYPKFHMPNTLYIYTEYHTYWFPKMLFTQKENNFSENLSLV